MGIYLAEQVSVFLQSILVGAALGLFYDAFRVSRVAFKTPRGVIFLEDVLFFSVCALVTFFFGLTVIDGALRSFLLIGELIGGTVYYFTLGRLVMGVSKKIIEAVKAVFRFVIRWVLTPLWRFFYRVTLLIMSPFVFLGRILKKILQNAKFRLKIRRKVLYNQLAGYVRQRGVSKKRKVRKDEKKQKAHT